MCIVFCERVMVVMENLDKSGKLNMVQRCVRVPIKISYPDKMLCGVLFEFLKDVLEEGRLLACESVLQNIAFLRNGSTGIPSKKTGDDMSKSGALYNMCVNSQMRRHFPTSSLATLINAYVVPLVGRYYKLAQKGKANIPTYKKSILPVLAGGTDITVSGKQFKISSKTFGFAVLHLTDGDIGNIVDRITRKKKFCVKRMKGENKEVNAISSKEEEIAELKKINKHLSVGVVAGMGKGIVFETCISKKDIGMLEIMNNVVNNTYKLSDSIFQINDKNEMFFLLSYKMPVLGNRVDNQGAADSDRILGIDLGCDCPIACAANKGHVGVRYFGYGEELVAQKSKFRAKSRRLQKASGFRSKSVNWDLSDEEKNWVKTYNRTLVARFFNQTVIPGGFRTIHAEDLSSLIAKQEPYKKVMWTPGMLLDMIRQKCGEMGIRFVSGNPRNSSIRCHKCGYTSKSNRSLESVKDFHCQKCNYTCHADYNAAMNIALWGAVEIEYGYESDDGGVEPKMITSDLSEIRRNEQDAVSVMLKSV